MNDQVQLAGTSKALLTPLSEPETLDIPPTLVNEGPFVVKYRDWYYMIYNANHTSRRYGNMRLAWRRRRRWASETAASTFPVVRSNHDPKHAGVAIPEHLPEIKNAGQPNLVRGPNGIEWWLVYFADQEKRSQYIDRAHFFGRELFIEGPTCAETPGYHPSPAPPSFRDLFDSDGAIETNWDLEGGWA